MQDIYQKPRIGFVLGDQAGIGPEIVLKLLHRPHLYERCRPLLIGNYELLMRLVNKMYPDCHLVAYRPDEISEGWNAFSRDGIPVVDISGDVNHVITGMVTNASGWITYRSIEEGYHLLEKGVIEGLILAPCTKESISKSGCGFHSEYEILEHCAGVEEVQTVVKGGTMQRISVVGHVPFREIPAKMTRERVETVSRRLAGVIAEVTGETPRLLVAALNPVEDNLLGEEERDIIVPAIEQLRVEGLEVNGPFAADTLFQKAEEKGCNGIVYMYHDQGNIAMKAQMFQATTCIYTNLPYPVLSTGHGSALDIAELGVANPTNISYVLSVMTDIIQRRRDTEATGQGTSA